MSAPKPRVKLPKSAAVGEIITIKTLISHEMESGQRVGADGQPIPRKIINRFVCRFEDQTVFECDLAPSISANPFFEFRARVPGPGRFTFLWVDDDGSEYTAEETIALA